MGNIRTALILIGLLTISVATADPGTGSGTGLKPGIAATTAVQLALVSTSSTGLGK